MHIKLSDMRDQGRSMNGGLCLSLFWLFSAQGELPDNLQWEGVTPKGVKSPLAMPGPWVTGAENPGFLPSMSWELGSIYEAVSYDTENHRQGKVLFEVVDVESANRRGRWMDITVISVEDADLLWWLQRGPGSKYEFEVRLHICPGQVPRCPMLNARKLQEFHTDAVRSIDVEDVRKRVVGYWSSGGNKRRFESWRKTILGDGAGSAKDKKKKPGGGEVTPDDLGFSPSEEEPADPKAKAGDGAEKKAEKLKARLTELKEAVAEKKDGRADEKKVKKRKKKDPEKPPKGDDKPEDDKDEADDPGLASSSTDDRRGRGSRTIWFGRGRDRSRSPVRLKPARKKGRPKEKEKKRHREKDKEDKDDETTESRGKRKEKKKRRMDRGPFGSGRIARYGGEKEADSDNSSESVFREGVPEKKAQQLMLFEYSEKKPGRLAARLLQKMELLLSRAGTPVYQTGMMVNSTPSVALPYLLTVIYPTYKEKLGVKLMRELRTLATAMDQIAQGCPEKAADVIGQRMKALELALADQGWVRAQYLELIPQEGAGLADPEEQRMASKEQAIEAKMRSYLPNPSWKREETPQGDPKGKGKKGKGKYDDKKKEGKGGEKEKEKAPAA